MRLLDPFILEFGKSPVTELRELTETKDDISDASDISGEEGLEQTFLGGPKKILSIAFL